MPTANTTKEIVFSAFDNRKIPDNVSSDSKIREHKIK